MGYVLCYLPCVLIYLSRPQVKELIIKKDPNLLDSFLDVSAVYYSLQG